MLYHKVPPSWGSPHVLKLSVISLMRTRQRRGKCHRGWRVSLPLFLWNVIPSHCWPLLTPSPQEPPLPERYANLCCALNRCPNNSLSGGGGGKPGLWQEKNAAIFMAGSHYHTAEDLYLGGGRGFRHTFPTIQISWVVKKKWWKGVESGVKSLRLCRAEAGEPCLRGPLPTQEVLC